MRSNTRVYTIGAHDSPHSIFNQTKEEYVTFEGEKHVALLIKVETLDSKIPRIIKIPKCLSLVLLMNNLFKINYV